MNLNANLNADLPLNKTQPRHALHKSEQRFERRNPYLNTEPAGELKDLNESKSRSREPRLALHETLKKTEKDEHAYPDIKIERSSMVKHREELAEKKKRRLPNFFKTKYFTRCN